MFSYDDGVAVALTLWIFSLIRLVVMINSQMEKNLNKIGLRLSWLTLTSKPAHMGTRRPIWKNTLKFLFILVLGAPFIFLSWAYVVFVMVLAYFVWEKNSGKPDVIKEFQWKMKNMDLPFDEVIKATMKVSNTDPSNFEEVREATLREMAENSAT